ncbi:TIR domain-containing protein [Nonomuraea glycinis]|uniref:TIR domain-containing protein n=1 Tax=Nonomuraea glycinis TaxID=2047744 RepID=A0A918E3J4_9ACTN|nr:TIR domain-containing protein [Nonomuraea glycinis]MCA2174811.1 TIR domain-containing protein [Nonomuraea glycinis]GGP01615.1 hypothetical protein GCM10012278_05560 [Nonomuraea glycinis]
MRGSEESRYDAFLSYAWEPDAPLVAAVRDALHRLARPWYRLRALRVFRDASSLAANSALDPAIEDALAASRCLIVFLSPSAVRSSWVPQEIDYWLRHKSVDSLRLVLTGGDLVWDASARGFDMERSTALPAVLRGVHRHRPLYVDLRWAHAEDQRVLRNDDFHRSVVQLAAPLHGKQPDELYGEDVRQHRRTRQVSAAAVIALAVLAASTAVAAVIAGLRAEEALANLRQATSRYLASQALADREGNLDRALLLAVHAWRTARTAAARSSLVTVVHEAMRGVVGFPRIRPGDPVPFHLLTLAISPDGRRMAASRYSEGGDAGAPADGRVYVWELAGGDARILRSPFERVQNVKRLIFGPDGRHLVAEDLDGQVLLWDLAGDPARVVRTAQAPLDVTADHHIAAVSSAGGGVVLLDLVSGGELGRRAGTLFEVDRRSERAFGKDPSERPVVWDLRSSRAVKMKVATQYGFAELAGDRVVMATGRDLTSLAGYDATTGERRWRAGLPGRAVAAAVSSDGGRFAVWTANGTVILVATKDGTVTGRARHAPGQDPRLSFSPSGRFLVAADSRDSTGRQTLLDARTVRVRWTKRGEEVIFGSGDKVAVVRGSPVQVTDLMTGDVIASGEADAWSAAVSPDGRHVALAGDDVRLIDLTAPEPRLVSLPGEPSTIYTVTFDPSGRRLAGVGIGGAAVVWDVAAALRPADVPTAPRKKPSALSSDGVTLVYADDSRQVRRRDLRDGKDLPIPGLSEVSGLRISPTGTHLLASVGSSYVLWSIAQAAAVLRFPYELGTETAFSGNGRRLAVARRDANTGRYTVTVHEVGSGAVVATIPLPDFAQPTDLTSALAYPVIALDETGGRLAASLSTRQIRTWEIASGAPEGGCDTRVDDYTLLSGSVQFTPDGRTLVVSAPDSETISFVDPASCAVRRSLTTGNGKATLSPDGTLLITESPLRLWDTQTLEPLGEPLLPPETDPDQIVFTADGSSVMALTADRSVRRWPVAPEALIRQACAVAGRELTTEEWDRFLPQGDRQPACTPRP